MIGATSDNSPVHRVSTAFCNVLRNTITASATQATLSIDLNAKAAPYWQGSNCRGGNGRIRVKHRRKESNIELDARENRHNCCRNNIRHTHTGKPTFYTLETSTRSESPSDIIGSCACDSVVGIETLDSAMEKLNIGKIEHPSV